MTRGCQKRRPGYELKYGALARKVNKRLPQRLTSMSDGEETTQLIDNPIVKWNVWGVIRKNTIIIRCNFFKSSINLFNLQSYHFLHIKINQ